MSAHWPVTDGQPIGTAPLRRLGLGTLLHATARRHPGRLLLIDPANKPAWSGRPAITWSYAAAAEIVGRLARGIRAWRLPPGAHVGLHLPATSEGALAYLAVEAAGYVPCPLPIAWGEDRVVTAVHTARLSAMLTQTRVGRAAPAERICGVAARCFGLRYLAAFGPDVPDGVIDLDRMILDGRGDTDADAGRQEPAQQETALQMPGGFVSFAGGDPDRPVARSTAALVAVAATHLMAQRVAPSERILSLLGFHDLRGLATGLGAALLAGAGLETLPVFDGRALAAALRQDEPTHLVVPAFLERSLGASAWGDQGRPAALRSVCYAHRAPALFPGRVRGRPAASAQGTNILDAVAFDETALVTGHRGSSSDVALVLGRPERLALPDTLMAMRHGSDGRLAFRGQACAADPLVRGVAAPAGPDEWRRTPYIPMLFSGIATAVSVPEPRAQDFSSAPFANA